jgi:hypothetical protein
MPLDESTRRFAFLLQRDVRRLAERIAERTARGEEMRADARLVTWETRSGDVCARQYCEVLAIYDTRDRILRWGWAGRASSASPSHGDTIVREAQARGVPQLAMSVVADLDLEDAEELGKLGAILARADGFVSRAAEGAGAEVELVGLFDRAQPQSSAEKFSVPPPAVESARPAVAREAPAPPHRSLPPLREVYAPRAPRADGADSRDDASSPPPRPSSPPLRRPSAPPKPSSSPLSPSSPPGIVREPARELFVPVANAAVRALGRSLPGYQQGLCVVEVSLSPRPEASRRVVVLLTAVDAAGVLRAPDPPRELVDVAVEMVEADRRAGNASWRKVSARIVPKPDGGATLQVDVV